MGQSSAVFDSTLFLACRHLLVCKITDDYAAEQQIWRHLSAARHFCSAKILAGGLRWGTVVLIAEGEVPAQRNFQRKFALRRVGSHKFVVPPTIERSKVREHAQLVQPSVPGSLGCQRGRCPSVSERVQRKPFQGFSLGNFFLTADAVLLCAAKKNGVGKWTSWQVSARLNWRLPPRTAKAKKKGGFRRPNTFSSWHDDIDRPLMIDDLNLFDRPAVLAVKRPIDRTVE